MGPCGLISNKDDDDDDEVVFGLGRNLTNF